MWKSFVNYCNRHSSDEVEQPRKPAVNAKPIYRDELEKKASKKEVGGKKRDCSAYSKPKEDGKDFEKKSYCPTVAKKDQVITVKVRMTKEEAARMLSNCKDGGLLDFKDVARELVRIPPNRVNVVSVEARTGRVLETIPEEIYM